MELRSIILFDGNCILCNSAVHLIIKFDPNKKFLFAALQSAIASELLSKNSDYIIDKTNSIVLVEGNKLYLKSTAVFRIIKSLAGPIRLLYFFIVIPKFFRDFIYTIIANYRYTLFGKKETCIYSSLGFQDRFLL